MLRSPRSRLAALVALTAVYYAAPLVDGPPGQALRLALLAGYGIFLPGAAVTRLIGRPPRDGLEALARHAIHGLGVLLLAAFAA
ncbi:MAG: hypothetical protein OEO21_12420, partial [Candidatus Krumholzibacteria bacterium]|nr:hypothetical protein [Candidatus Krumholzibacteria bacterium]